MLTSENLDIFKHRLVPEHIILTEEEKKELFKKYKITEKNLPKILKNDAAVKALGAKEGDVIKIIRNSPVAGTVPYYRVVVKK